MPCLVVFKLPQHPSSEYDDWDVIDVLPEDQHPGQAVVGMPWRYGFLFITDKRADQVRSRLVRPLYSDTLEYDGGTHNHELLGRRRRKILPAFLPPSVKVRKYSPYSSDDAVKFSWAEFNTNTHDKRADHGLGPGGVNHNHPDDEVQPD